MAVRDFPGVLEPGFENRMTSPARIEEMRVQGFPVIDAPSRREGERYVPLPGGGLAPPPLPQPGLLGQATEAVQRLDATVGRVPDEASDRLAFNLASLAKREGFVSIDHAVLSVATDHLPPGENVFVVQGEPTAPTNRVAHMRSADAVDLPTREALVQLRETAGPTHALDPPRQQGETEQLGSRLVRT